MSDQCIHVDGPPPPWKKMRLDAFPDWTVTNRMNINSNNYDVMDENITTVDNQYENNEDKDGSVDIDDDDDDDDDPDMILLLQIRQKAIDLCGGEEKWEMLDDDSREMLLEMAGSLPDKSPSE